MSRSNLRLGASEGESDALFGKGSGSGGTKRGGGGWRCERSGRSEFAEQAVALEAFDPDRLDLPDDVGRRHHMGGLQISGAADDLPVLAGGALEQHLHGASDRSPVEGRLLAV